MTLFGQEHIDRYVATDGKEGHDWEGTQTLILTTTGRRSGEPRPQALIYGKHGDDYLVVASKGGSPRRPAWIHNLRAHPDTTIQVGRRVIPVHARVVDSDDERLSKMVGTQRHQGVVARVEPLPASHSLDDTLDAQPGRERQPSQRQERCIGQIEQDTAEAAGLQHEIQRFQRTLDRFVWSG